MNKVAAICLAVLVTGCAQGVWVNPGVSAQQAQREFAECQYDVVKNTPTYDGVGDPIAAGIASGTRKNQIMASCMQMKGYHLEASK